MISAALCDFKMLFSEEQEMRFDNVCWEPGEIANRPYLLLGAQTGQQGVERGNVLTKSHLPPRDGVYILGIIKEKGRGRGVLRI